MAAMPRFDDRLPPKGKDGGDFQRFVWEALRSGHFELLLAGRYVRPHFAPGRDGAIDHVAVGAEDRIVFECKFFGRDRGDQPRSDWVEVGGTLGKNLKANADRPRESIARSYKPWFDLAPPDQELLVLHKRNPVARRSDRVAP